MHQQMVPSSRVIKASSRNMTLKLKTPYIQLDKYKILVNKQTSNHKCKSRTKKSMTVETTVITS